jgi:hypothetical protein
VQVVNIKSIKLKVLITVAARSKAWTVFARSDAGIVGSNPSNGMDVCVCVYSVFVLSCVWVEALRRADHSSKEFYRLCKKDYETYLRIHWRQTCVVPLLIVKHIFAISFNDLCSTRPLRVLENRVLRLFGPKRDEVTGRWRKLHNE